MKIRRNPIPVVHEAPRPILSFYRTFLFHCIPNGCYLTDPVPQVPFLIHSVPHDHSPHEDVAKGVTIGGRQQAKISLTIIKRSVALKQFKERVATSTQCVSHIDKKMDLLTFIPYPKNLKISNVTNRTNNIQPLNSEQFSISAFKHLVVHLWLNICGSSKYVGLSTLVL